MLIDGLYLTLSPTTVGGRFGRRGLSQSNSKVTVSTDPSSVGSKYAWVGEVTGEGKLTHKVLEQENSLKMN